MLLAAVVLMLPWFGVWVKSRSDLAAENLALRSQLALFHLSFAKTHPAKF